MTKSLKILFDTDYPRIIARLIEPIGGDHEPQGPIFIDVKDAFRAAAEKTGAQSYSDGVWLDMQDADGAEDLARGIVIRVLMHRGYTLTIEPGSTEDIDKSLEPPETA